MQEIPKQPPGPRTEAFNLHKSIGLVVLALMLARTTHLLLYAVLVALPVTGYLGSMFSGYPVKLFGMTLPAWPGKSAEIKEWMSAAHLGPAWALAIAFAMHMAGVAKHTLVNHDRLLRRMSWKRAPQVPVTSMRRAE